LKAISKSCCSSPAAAWEPLRPMRPSSLSGDGTSVPPSHVFLSAPRQRGRPSILHGPSSHNRASTTKIEQFKRQDRAKTREETSPNRKHRQ
jgi:hypothetical protein